MPRASTAFVVVNRSGQPRAVFTTRSAVTKWLRSLRVPFVYSVTEIPTNTVDPSAVRHYDVRTFLLED